MSVDSRSVIKGNVLQNSKSLHAEDFHHHWMSASKPRMTLVGQKYSRENTAKINLGQVKYIRKIQYLILGRFKPSLEFCNGLDTRSMPGS